MCNDVPADMPTLPKKFSVNRSNPRPRTEPCARSSMVEFAARTGCGCVVVVLVGGVVLLAGVALEVLFVVADVLVLLVVVELVVLESSPFGSMKTGVGPELVVCVVVVLGCVPAVVVVAEVDDG